MSPARRLPAEWAPQSAVMLTWPHDGSDWGAGLPDIEENFLAIATAIARFQTLLVSCRDTEMAEQVRGKLLSGDIRHDRFRIGIAPSYDVWARDHGPITVLDNNSPELLNFQFNGWGGKYPHELDNRITSCLHEQGIFGAVELTDIEYVLEGGAIETDGEGILLTTRRCLPLDNRNPGVAVEDFEYLFRQWFGVHTVHWLSRGHLIGDDTDGHIDTLARFADPQSIVYQSCEDATDEHYQELRAMREELAALRRPDGQRYRLHALPLPRAQFDSHGRRLPAGYANFLIINGAVLMPGYADPADELAAEILSNCFPGREVITIDCRALIRQYGSLHCVTMQIPAKAPLTQA